VFTVEQRDALRAHVLELVENDERIVAGAAVGSLAVGSGDRFSDLDLTFAVKGAMPVADVLEDWTRTLAEELDAVQLADLEVGPTVYRVFLLPDALQFDLSLTPAAEFRPAGPRFQLLFGETAAEEPERPPGPPGRLSIPTPAVAETSSAGASSTPCTHGRASSADASGRRSTTSAPCATTHSRSHVFAWGSWPPLRAATTTSRLRRLRLSSTPTWGRSSATLSVERSPHRFSLCWTRAPSRGCRTRRLSKSASPKSGPPADAGPLLSWIHHISGSSKWARRARFF